MNLQAVDQAKAIGRGVLAVLLVAVMVGGVIFAARLVADPFGLGQSRLASAQSAAAVNGQQAASNAAGAAIGDRRATNVANIAKTAQEARHAVQSATDYDDAVARYLDGLDRLRDAGGAGFTDAAADGWGSHPDAAPEKASPPATPASQQP